jgi:hypothetical protein
LTMTAADALPAFPGAEGFGKYAVGGRYGSVYRVTNLNDSGTGSLRDAVSTANRIIIFDVSGVIKLNSRLVFKNNLYVAGQTAPGEGITVYGNGVSFSGASNTIVRYLRFRMGSGGDSGKDAAGVANGTNIIFDHLSVSWGLDETFSISSDGKGALGDITIQNSIMSQGLMTHSAGGLMQADHITLYRNLYVDNSTRNNKIKGTNQYVNNIVYNWKNGCYIMGGDSQGTSYCNATNNLFINGPAVGGNAFTGGLFANDSVLAVVEGPAGTFNAIHEHASANTYMLIPFGPDAVVVEGESNLSDDAISLINNAVNYLIESKAMVVAVMTPSISSDYRDELTIVSIKCATPDATVYYTTDGSEPTENSPIYTAPFQVTEDSTLVKAFAVKQGYDDSKTAAATILVKKVAKTPVIVLEAQEGKTVVSITCATEDATVYYNYTGSKSIAASAVYTAPIEVRYPLTIAAFASGGSYIDSDITSKEIGVTGITKDNIRLDTLAHFDANSTDWYWETEGGSSKVAYYVGKNAKSAYASIDTIVEGNDTTYNYHFIDDIFIYAQNDSLNAKDNGWFMRTKGQVLQWENTNPLMEVGYAGATGYYADAVEDMITTPTRYHITFGPKKSGEPFTASIETSQKHQGPFDIITFVGNNNSDGANLVLVLEISLDGEEWTTIDTLGISYYRRFWKRNVSHYEGSDEVFVRITQVAGGTKAVVYDILLMNNGEVSQGYVALPVHRQAAEVVATEYYNLNGIRMAGPAYQGITIVKKIYSDGYIKVEKIFIK